MTKLTGCDSIKQGLLKTTSDTVRLVSCLTISGCDSIRLGILKPNSQDTIRLLSCIKITGCDSLRLGILKPNTQDTLRLSCIVLTIGQKFQGGILAYILEPGDPGYDANIKHGLIAAASAQSIDKLISWSNAENPYIVVGAIDTAIGSGLSNTNKIIAIQGGIPTTYAAGVARAYSGGGYTDWFLPSKDELNKLYINKMVNQGVFSGNLYWSSTEFNGEYAWFQDVMTNGKQIYGGKGGRLFIRAIRAF